MVATVVLGILVAVAFAFGAHRIYRNFSTGESPCCGADGCGACASAGGNYGQWIDEVNKFDYRKAIDIRGMTCAHCAQAVKQALEKVDGVAVAAVSIERGAARVGMERDVSDEALQEAVRGAGYKPGICATA